jgi:hypothetical protein
VRQSNNTDRCAKYRDLPNDICVQSLTDIEPNELGLPERSRMERIGCLAAPASGVMLSIHAYALPVSSLRATRVRHLHNLHCSLPTPLAPVHAAGQTATANNVTQARAVSGRLLCQQRAPLDGGQFLLE